MKGVFDISGAWRYDDLIAARYHFPGIYLRAAEACVGDWVVYRETGSAGGRKAYVAAGLVHSIDPDPADCTLFSARISDFIEFDRPVPYRDPDGRFRERMLREVDDPATAGWALRGRSVRAIADADFAAIVNVGLVDTLSPEQAIRLELDPRHIDAPTAALLASPPDERRVAQLLVNRKVRRAAFCGHVLDAYDNRCAATGLRMVDGGGKAEAQAAHIWSVADGGPDVVQNGIALSTTAHWLFDRHFISLDDECRLLVSHDKVPSELIRLFPQPGERIHLPADPRLYPRHDYVAWHRARFAGLNA
ncbi:HNH endonuclease [Sphingomonas sp. S2-65]|uniref:HNH endonuclease n=1 Tax=Sphingomonas sp. S2-65 TaxID=2903960 RepID=UPI001F245D95|nr:HNH endonuclease [Sphingomonas sp. S2-65]UYY57082.1 HNH endonuclease [Sphingomonas sp. S2-65]